MTPLEVIQKNITATGIAAGSTHFHDVWARDAFYACWGLLHTGNYAPVRRTLDTFVSYQSSQGQIPLRIGRKNMLFSYMGLPSARGARYDTDKGKAPALDPNTLFIITVDRLAQSQDRKKTYNKYEGAVTKALQWLFSQSNDVLLDEGWYASWDDALKKSGASIYNNALYYAALHAASRITGKNAYKTKARTVQKKLYEVLWNGEYFRAWTDMDVMDVAGNLLAILFGVTTKTQTTSIMESLERYKQEYGDTLPRTNYPVYPAKKTSFLLHAIGLGDYHNCKPYWLWIAALELLVRQQLRREPNPLREEIADWIRLSGGYYELYEAKGKPLRRLIYRSEKDFSWACGILLLTR